SRPSVSINKVDRSGASSRSRALGRERHRRPVQTGQDRPRPWVSGEQFGRMRFAGDADRSRKAVGSRRPRTDHGHIDSLVGARSSERVKDVVKASARLESGAVTTGHRERHVLKLDHAVNAVAGRTLADANAPAMSVRVPAERAEFSEVHDGALEAL